MNRRRIPLVFYSSFIVSVPRDWLHPQAISGNADGNQWSTQKAQTPPLSSVRCMSAGGATQHHDDRCPDRGRVREVHVPFLKGQGQVLRGSSVGFAGEVPITGLRREQRRGSSLVDCRTLNREC